MDPTQPGDIGLTLDPLVVLFDPLLEVVHPAGEFLVGLGG